MAQNARVVSGLPSRYVAPTCPLKAGHFKVQSGATYLKTGIETRLRKIEPGLSPVVRR